MKKLLFIMFLLLPSVVLAKSKTKCDYTLVSNLKKLVSNINITYTYHLSDDMANFDITLTNIPNDVYFIDNSNKQKYYYSDTNNGVITISNYASGKVSYAFYSNNNDCLNEKLMVKNVNLPYYNKLYNSEECMNIPDYSLCQKWITNNYNYYDYLDKINKYNSQLTSDKIDDNIDYEIKWFDRFIKFCLSYYYIVMPMIILVIVGIIYIVKLIKFKKNRFEI